jgi:hypothetical protein
MACFDMVSRRHRKRPRRQVRSRHGKRDLMTSGTVERRDVEEGARRRMFRRIITIAAAVAVTTGACDGNELVTDAETPAAPNDETCKNPPFRPVPVTSTIISDFDGDSGQSLRATEPHGAWTKHQDPELHGPTTVAIKGCGTTGNGLHFTGDHLSRDPGPPPELWGADISAFFINDRQPVDARAYSGVSFVLRSEKHTRVIVKLYNADSQPEPACGLCDDAIRGRECYAGYRGNVDTDPGGMPHALKWVDFKEAAWGFHFPDQSHIDASSLVRIMFAIDEPEADAGDGSFAVCIDDVRFY